MKSLRHRRILLAGAAVLAVALPCALARGVTSGDMTQDRYRTILDRAPFGPPPPPPVVEPPAPPAGTNDVPEVPEGPHIIPPGLDKIKITLLSRFHGTPAAGFLDGETSKSYYLLEGQEFDGILCKGIDYARATVTLSKGGYEAELPLWVNPATTNCADVTTFGQPGGQGVDLASLPTKTDWEQERDRTEAQRRMEEHRARREARRKEMEERRRQHAEEMERLTPEERERRMQDIAVDIIVNDSGPPLPIELNEESMQKLRDAGFEVPEGAGQGSAPRRRIGIPGGGHRPPGRWRGRPNAPSE